jgi:hypothetical protein
MDIDNDPIVSGGNFLFCEVGNDLALQFIRAARCVVEFAGCADPCELRDNVDTALADLLGHRYACRDCLVMMDMNLSRQGFRNTSTENHAGVPKMGRGVKTSSGISDTSLKAVSQRP